MEVRCFLFLLFLVLPALTQAGCPGGWVEIDDCCYFFSDEKVSYEQAKYDCMYRDADLVSFDDCETLDDVTSSGESCPYWIHPTTDLDCLEPYPDEENKYICKIPKASECELHCGGTCQDEFRDGCITSDMPMECECPGSQYCCPEGPSCKLTCEGECIFPDSDMNNLGCDGYQKDPDDCPCPPDMICCCNKTVTPPPPTEQPTVTPCPQTPKPSFTDEHGCGVPEVSDIPGDKVFDYEAVYEALMAYQSDPYAADVKYDQVREQFEKLGQQDGESLTDMTGDLTDAIRAEKNVYVLQYTDENGYELAIMLPGFDPKTGELPADLDFTDPAFDYEFKEQLLLLKQRYSELKLNVNIPDFIPNDCDFVVDIQLNAHFRLLRVPLILVACVTIECQVVIVVPVVCFEITCEWIGEPTCEWEFRIRIVIKKLIIHLTYWVRVWWISAFPQMAIQQLPDCPAPGMGDIAPFEEFNPGFMDFAMDNFLKSELSEAIAGELNVNTFRAVYDMDLGEQGGTALMSMEGSVTSRVIGFKNQWMLVFKESEDDMETSILLENFDPTVDELPDAYDLGDLSSFGSYKQRYLQIFSYRYMEMRATVSLRAIFPTNCGTAVYSVRLNARFTLRRFPFFLIACWEIFFTDYLIIPIPCFEIYIICGIRVVLPVIKVIIIRRSFWFGLWVFPIPAPCPWPPAATPGSSIAFLNPTGLAHGDTCRYVCDLDWVPCPPYYNPLVCLWGNWWFKPFQLHCSRNCPPAPPAGFGAFRAFCVSVLGWRSRIKQICFYRCLPGWVPWWGSFMRKCVNGIWTGWPLICLPPWIIGPPWWPPPIWGPPRPELPPPGEPNLPCDCKDIHDMDPTLASGVYMVYPMDDQPGCLVYCDMETDGGGWTVIQRRQDGSVDFYLDWDDYKHGFPSNMTGEFWLGNDKIHRFTTQKNYTLRVDLEANDGETAYAEYSSFSVNNEGDNYRINIAGYSGTAGDSMTATDGGQSINQQAFSTFDDDNDVWNEGSCANRFMGAWWYCACSDSNLNGMYGSSRYGKGVVWKTFRGMSESLPFTEMKIRP